MIGFILIFKIYRRNSTPNSFNIAESDSDKTIGCIYDDYVESRESHMYEIVPEPLTHIELNRHVSKETNMGNGEPGIISVNMISESRFYTNTAFN